MFCINVFVFKLSILLYHKVVLFGKKAQFVVVVVCDVLRRNVLHLNVDASIARIYCLLTY